MNHRRIHQLSEIIVKSHMNLAPHQVSNKTAVLLINLGTPSAPRPSAIRRFLRQFLSDRRVVELPRLLWLMILYLIILPLRPFTIAKKYQSIWQSDGSPLFFHSQALADSLQQAMHQQYGDDIQVHLAMRYGQPSIDSVMQTLQKSSIRKLIVLPLYPQYAASTTASSIDAVNQALSQWRFQPSLHVINSYHDFPPYIQSIKSSISSFYNKREAAEKLLISFHGLPKRSLELGDPYYCFCHKSARLIANALNYQTSQWQMVFQSRFGKAEWLQPYCEKTLIELAQAGVKTVDVICPGFATDCLETLEEIQQSYAESFIQAGGKQLRYIPALNASPEHITMLAQLVKPYLS